MSNSPFKSSGSSTPERQQSTDQSELGLEAGPATIEQAVKCKCPPIYAKEDAPLADFCPVHGLEEYRAPQYKTVSASQRVPSASEKAAMVKANVAAERQKQELEKLSAVTSLDWKQIPPPMLAQILINMPFKGASGEPDYYLQPWQAMVFALRTYELGLSPFSNEVWFNPKNNKVNVTFEGKLKLARMNGMKLSPPLFERIPADAKQALVAYKCTIVSPSGKCEYTATLKEWMVARSSVWKEKPDHMLQLRAAEKCLSFATGSGSSELMGEQDLQTGKEAEQFIPSFTSDKV